MIDDLMSGELLQCIGNDLYELTCWEIKIVYASSFPNKLLPDKVYKPN